MLELPKTLLEWKLYKASATPFWELLRPFFEEHGYILWKDDHGFARPRDFPDAIRAKDEYHEWIDYVGPSQSSMPIERRTLFPARTKDRRDVMIRIVAKGDQGQEHLKILKHLAQADAEKQHVLPLLELLEKDDMVFAVFPFVGPNDLNGWFHDLEEALDFLRQIFETFAFLHEHRIAHRDYGAGEVLLNFAGDRWGLDSQLDDLSSEKWSWRKSFKVCYWITDFELSVQFDADSEPSSRLVQGIPSAAWGHADQDYRKELAPESLQDDPYCPFKADVYQVGFCAFEIFCRIRTSEPLRKLLWEMRHPKPHLRPTFAAALSRLQRIRAELSPETLAEAIEEGYCNPNASHILPENRIDVVEDDSAQQVEADSGGFEVASAQVGIV